MYGTGNEGADIRGANYTGRQSYMANYCMRHTLRPLCIEGPVLAGANNPVREPNWGRLVGQLNRLANIRGTPEIGM